MLRILPVLFIALMGLIPVSASAQAELVPDVVHIERAKVLEVSNEGDAALPGIGASSQIRTLKVEVIDGPDEGQVVTFDDNYPARLEPGDIFFLRHQIDKINGVDYWAVSSPYRLHVLLVLSLIFLALLFVFGGIQGVRGLASLLGSLILIFYVLLPSILGGYSPILVSIGVSSLIILAGSYITHGFNRTTSSAVLGMLITVVATGIGAYYVVHLGNFSGYATEESTYLSVNAGGNISMIGLLFGGIMIGLLGVLYDIAIGQAIVVEELFRAGKHLTRIEVYTRAIRIGREHIGALVNTLAIAYVGAALPLLLLLEQNFSMPDSSGTVLSMLNGETVATEIVRILIGSIGIILAVPVTTLVSTFILEKHRSKLETEPGHAHHHHH